MTFASGSKIGKYVLRRRLGHGGFGVVVAAHDTGLDREVALKFLKPEHAADPQVVQRFLREARAAAKVVHPGIVTIYEASEVRGTRTPLDGTAYIAMELLEGESLLDRRAKVGRMTAAMAIDLGRQLASALEAAHRAGIVHRDLKPENIYLVPDSLAPGGERVKVFDFGIAKVLDPEAQSPVKTQSIQVFGTPRYMSPEQCASAANVDHRSDIYTLGCILFELVAGQPPYAGSVGELIAHHLMSPPPAIRAHVPDIAPPLERVIARMLAKQPADRPQSMAHVQRELEQCLRDPAATASVPLSEHHRVPTGDPQNQVHILPAPTTLGSAARSRSLQSIDRAADRRRTWMYVAAAACALAIPLVLYLALRQDDEPVRVASTGASGEGASGASGTSASGANASGGAASAGASGASDTSASGAGASGGAASAGAASGGASGDPSGAGASGTGAVASGADPSGAVAAGTSTRAAGKSKSGKSSSGGRVGRDAPTPAGKSPANPAGAPGTLAPYEDDSLTRKRPVPDKPVPDKPALGTLAIRVKPECEIYVDGKLASGRTGYRELALPPGRHQIMLINRDLKVDDRFVVDIKSGEVDRIAKEYGDKRNATINPFEKGAK